MIHSTIDAKRTTHGTLRHARYNILVLLAFLLPLPTTRTYLPKLLRARQKAPRKDRVNSRCQKFKLRERINFRGPKFNRKRCDRRYRWQKDAHFSPDWSNRFAKGRDGKVSIFTYATHSRIFYRFSIRNSRKQHYTFLDILAVEYGWSIARSMAKGRRNKRNRVAPAAMSCQLTFLLPPPRIYRNYCARDNENTIGQNDMFAVER